MYFRQVFDSNLAQYAYLIGCQRTGEALVVDPERDVDRYLEAAAAGGLKITAATETHIHADFLSGTRELASRGVKVYLSGEGGDDWWYDWTDDPELDVQLVHDGDTFSVGNIEIRAIHSPGHTPEHLSFLVLDGGGGAAEPMGIATGDFVFAGGLGRPDLLETVAGEAGAMEPAARSLFASLPRFLELPDYLQVWPGHGAGSACGKSMAAVPVSTVGYEKRNNAALLEAEQGEEFFVGSILQGQPEPPLYFARMKRLNKQGPPILGGLPRPRRITVGELCQLAGRLDVAVLDTRLDRAAFMRGHLTGSIYAPLDKTFPEMAGSYVEAETPIYLLADEERVATAVRQLIRIGLDHVVGWLPPEALSDLDESLTATETIDLPRGKELRTQPGFMALDVRRKTEFELGHVPGAVNIAHTRLLARTSELPDEDTMLVYCRTGARAASAASALERLGHRVLYVDDDIEKRDPASI